MRSIATVTVLAVALAVVFTLGAAAGADAKRTRAASQLSVQSVGPDGVSGRVSSAKGKVCRAQRQITVYRVNSGPSVPSSEFVATTWTHGDGSWSVPGPLYPSQFFAVVAAKSSKRVVCGPATSNAELWG